MRMGQGVRTGLGHGGITCVLQTQFSSSFIVLNEGKKLVKKAYAETERKCTSSGFTCTFPTMTIMMDKSPRHTTPVAYKKR